MGPVLSNFLDVSTDMAKQSPAKKLSKTVKGYLYNVSPLKDTKKPYFDAVLQHEDKYSKIVAFRQEDHIHFQNAEKTRSPVILQNVILQPSKSSEKMQVFYTCKSKMSCVRDLGHAFKKALPDKPQDVKLSELRKLVTEPQKVNINVKIILKKFKGNNVVWDGQCLPKTVYTIADSTAHMSLTVWCEQNITVGDWYKITNVSVKQFKGKTSLSTTKQTQILNIPSQDMVVADKAPMESIRCEIIGVNMKNLFICHRKHELKDFIPSSPSVYCPSCETHYKTTAAIMKISGHLDLKSEMGGIITASIEDEVIRSVMAVKPNASQNDIIQGLMSLPPMQITICNNVIVKMEDSKSEHTLNPAVESDGVLLSHTSSAVVKAADSTDFCSPPDLGRFSSQPKERTSTN